MDFCLDGIRNQKSTAYLLISVAFILTIILFPPDWISDLSSNRILSVNITALKRPKVILAWTKFAKVFIAPVLPVEKLFKNCPEFACTATLDRTQASTADALIFHMPEFRMHDLPPLTTRSPHQAYIFANFESAGNRYLIPSWKHWNVLDRKSGGFFNMTMTYRRDSDAFFDIFSQFYEPHLIENRTNLLVKKSAGVLWLVSHCKTNSHREDYVAELSKFIHVDKFGKCSGLGVKNPCVFSTCPAGFIGSYKFYLALENSLCRDYVTEKLYWALNNDVVPIVMGGANYSEYLPADSYINVEDFTSPKHLADHLRFLMSNETAYTRLLAWKFSEKPVWRLPNLPKPGDSGWCKLCRLLHAQGQHEQSRRAIQNITDWWLHGQCRSFPIAKQLFDSKKL